MPDLMMIVPSRGRPDRLHDLLVRWVETTTGHADMLVVVDDDDPALSGYVDLGLTPVDKPGGAGPCLAVGTRLGLAGSLNRWGVALADKYPMLGFLGDDHAPRSIGWDALFCAELRRMGTGMVYGNDLFQGGNLPTQIAMTSDIIRTLGCMTPGTMRHLYIDNAWLDLGRGVGRMTYLADAWIEHLHPAAGKAQYDESYAETNSDERYRLDQAAYDEWKTNGMPGDLAALRTLIGGAA